MNQIVLEGKIAVEGGEVYMTAPEVKIRIIADIGLLARFDSDHIRIVGKLTDSGIMVEYADRAA